MGTRRTWPFFVGPTVSALPSRPTVFVRATVMRRRLRSTSATRRASASPMRMPV